MGSRKADAAEQDAMAMADSKGATLVGAVLVALMVMDVAGCKGSEAEKQEDPGGAVVVAVVMTAVSLVVE